MSSNQAALKKPDRRPQSISTITRSVLSHSDQPDKAALEQIRQLLIQLGVIGTESQTEIGPQTLPPTGFLRLWDIIGSRAAKKKGPVIPPLIPVCSATWWGGVKTGRFPEKSDELGGRIACWRVEVIRDLIKSGAWRRAPRSAFKSAKSAKAP
jgi:prophage regulatory protein